MVQFQTVLVVLGMLALKGLFTVALVYIGARLAIRHERGVAAEPALLRIADRFVGGPLEVRGDAQERVDDGRIEVGALAARR